MALNTNLHLSDIINNKAYLFQISEKVKDPANQGKMFQIINGEVAAVSVDGSMPFVIGDIKNSYQTNDHGNWLMLDGRQISSLSAITASQKSNLALMFSGGYLPDHRAKVTAMANPSTNKNSTFSTRAIGDVAGEEKHTLTIDEIPSHTHSYTRVAFNGGGGAGICADNGLAGQTNNYSAYINSTGGGQAHSVMQPTIFANTFVYCG